jgi:hypothetical protein
MKVYGEMGDEWTRDWSFDYLIYVRSSAYFFGYDYTAPSGSQAPDVSRIKLPGDPFLDQYAEENMELYTNFETYNTDWPFPQTKSSSPNLGTVGMDDFAAVCWYNAWFNFFSFGVKLTHLWSKSKSLYVKGYNGQKIYIKTARPFGNYGFLANRPYGEFHFNNVVDTVKSVSFSAFPNAGESVRAYPYKTKNGEAASFRLWYLDYFNLLRRVSGLDQLVLVQQFRTNTGGYYGITQIRHDSPPNTPTQSTAGPPALGLPMGQQSFGPAEAPAPLSFPPSPADLYTVNQPGSGSTVGTSPGGGFGTGTSGEE